MTKELFVLTHLYKKSNCKIIGIYESLDKLNEGKITYIKDVNKKILDYTTSLLEEAKNWYIGPSHIREKNLHNLENRILHLQQNTYLTEDKIKSFLNVLVITLNTTSDYKLHPEYDNVII